MQKRRAPNHTTVVAERSNVISSTGKEMLELAKEYARTRSPKLRDRLILANKPLVIKISKRYRNFVSDRRDLIQEGYIGLMVGLEKFDPSRGYALSTYVAPWIRAYVQRAAWRELSVVETNMREKRPPELEEPTCEDEFANRPMLRSISAALQSGNEGEKVSRERRRKAMLQRDVPLQRQMTSGKNDSTRTLLDFLSQTPDSIEDAIWRKQTARIVHLSLAMLKARDREIIDRCYMKDEPQTRQGVATEFDISLARISQLSRRARNQLREFLEENGINHP